MSLTRVATGDLEILARTLERADPEATWTSSRLRGLGLGHLAGPLSALAGPGATRRMLLPAIRAVLDERRARASSGPELVWTGPEFRPTRDTAIVVRDLFERATDSVLVAGYTFDHGQTILAPLHRAMADRGVDVVMFLQIDRADAPDSPRDHAAAIGRRFLRRNWPFGEPLPRLAYDPRTAEHESLARKIHERGRRNGEDPVKS